MPIPGARYRYKDGVRLAFVGDKVVETKKKGEAAHMVKKKRAKKRRKRMMREMAS